MVGIETFAVVVYGLDTGEEIVVHCHFIAELRIFWVECLGDFHHFGRRIRLIESEEYSSHAVEDFTTALEGHDGVVEGSAVGIGSYFQNLSLFLVDTAVESSEVVAVFDFVERRNLVLCVVWSQERIVCHIGFTLMAASTKRQSCGRD